ncbi:MAG: hypothetical protein ACTSVZ_13145 [Promethearchaeota archaeon]
MLNILLTVGTTDYHMMDWWFDTFGNWAWVFMILGWVIYFGLSGLFAYLVHKDALRRKMDNPDIWMILVFFSNIVGVFLYCLAKSNYSGRSEYKEEN